MKMKSWGGVLSIYYMEAKILGRNPNSCEGGKREKQGGKNY